jgi:hypothetical protein
VTRALWIEAVSVTVVLALLAALLPVDSGFLGWSWDALNHHVYLGLIAESPRWHLDVIPASSQSYQYPYLYWPVYRLSLWQGDPVVGAALWSGLQGALLAPPVWLVGWRLLPVQARAWEDRALRSVACAMAFMSLVVLSSLEATANDLLAATPLLWAIAIGARPGLDDRRAGLAAALWGVGCAFKLSATLFVPWLLVWWLYPFRPGAAALARRATWISFGAAAGFVVAYAPWGWQLWQATGNPVHPLLGQFLGGR